MTNYREWLERHDEAVRAAFPRTLDRANQARRDITEFNHKAVHLLAVLGWKVCLIADELDISERTVWRLLKQPCEAREVERQEAQERRARVALARTCDPFLTDEDMPWLSRKELHEATSTRGKVREYLAAGHSQVEIVKLSGLSKQLISYHVQQLKKAA